MSTGTSNPTTSSSLKSASPELDPRDKDRELEKPRSDGTDSDFEGDAFLADAWQRHDIEEKHRQAGIAAQQRLRDITTVINGLLDELPEPNPADTAPRIFDRKQVSSIVRAFCKFGKLLRSVNADDRLNVIGTAIKEKRFQPLHFELRFFVLGFQQKRKELRAHLALMLKLPVAEQERCWRNVRQFTDFIVWPPWPSNTLPIDQAVAHEEWPSEVVDHLITEGSHLSQSKDPLGQFVDRCEQLEVILDLAEKAGGVDVKWVDANIRDLWRMMRWLCSNHGAERATMPDEPKQIASPIEARQAIDSALKWAATLRKDQHPDVEQESVATKLGDFKLGDFLRRLEAYVGIWNTYHHPLSGSVRPDGKVDATLTAQYERSRSSLEHVRGFAATATLWEADGCTVDRPQEVVSWLRRWRGKLHLRVNDVDSLTVVDFAERVRSAMQRNDRVATGSRPRKGSTVATRIRASKAATKSRNAAERNPYRDTSESADGLIIEPGAFIFRGQRVELSGKPLRVLEELMAAKGRPIVLADLRVQCWGSEAVSGEEAIRSAVKAARTALRQAFQAARVKSPPRFDPIPNVDRGTGRTAWRLELP